MKAIKRAYYQAMYELTDCLMWCGDSANFTRFWNISNRYRSKRDAL